MTAIIRKATPEDYDTVWNIFQQVIQTEDTYVFPSNSPKEVLQPMWFASYMETYVAEIEDEIVGTYILKPNQLGLGSHIANASYMVDPKHQGQGIGGQLCAHSIELAKTLGYVGIQFNIVVSTNTAAIALWQKFGFEIIGTTPKGFNHAILGLVDTYIMYKALD